MSWPVLVLEDDAILRDALLMALEEEDYEAHGAASGREALQLAERHRFAVAVADVRMEGPDGIDVLARLKAAHPPLHCVVITGYAGDDAPLRALKVQVEDYLYKPFSSAILLRTLQRLQGRQAEADLLGRLFRQLLSKVRLQPQQHAAGPGEVAYIEAARHTAFRSFYVGVRSRRIESAEGIQVYDLLEEAERRRTAYVHSGSAQADAHVTLHKGYQSIHQLALAVERERLPEREPANGQISRASFRQLYGRIQSGALSLEQVKLAPVLRLADPVTRATDPELLALAQLVWE